MAAQPQRQPKPWATGETLCCPQLHPQRPLCMEGRWKRPARKPRTTQACAGRSPARHKGEAEKFIPRGGGKVVEGPACRIGRGVRVGVKNQRKLENIRNCPLLSHPEEIGGSFWDKKLPL